MHESTYARKMIAAEPILARAAEDESYRQQLIDDPKQTLSPALHDAPQNLAVTALEDRTDLRHIVVPFLARPVAEEIKDLETLPADSQRDLYARIFSDDDFRARLTADPRRALSELVPSIPESIEFRVVQETETQRYVVLSPVRELDEELSDAELEMAAGGLSGGTGCAASHSSPSLGGVTLNCGIRIGGGNVILPANMPTC